MGIHDFFMKMNVATGGQNPNDALMQGLRSLGLSQTQQQGASSEYGGWFGRRQAGMSVDGSAVTGASHAAYARAGSLGAASALGLVSSGYVDYATRMNDRRARSGMQGAQMQIRWWVASPSPAPASVRVTRDANGGHPLGAGLFGAMDGAAWARVAQPNVLGPLSQAQFHAVELSGHHAVAVWTPPMREYQHIAASPDLFVRTSHAALSALSILADHICGPA